MHRYDVDSAETHSPRYNMIAPSQALFAPFHAHLWKRDEALLKKDPVGATRREATDVGWIMSVAAYTREDAVIDGARALAYATRLRREGPVAERLYRKLALRADDLVTVTEVEVAMGCTWGEVDLVEEGRRIDPYFWKMLETSVRDSVVGYVARLDRACALLPGNDSSQTCDAVSSAMQRVSRGVGHTLSVALLKPDCTTASLLALLAKMRAEALSSHAELARAYMRDQLRGVRALALLASSAPDKLLERLQEVDADLALLLSCMPAELEQQFQKHSVSVNDLAVVFVRTQTGGLVHVPSVVPPASLAVRTAVFSKWLARSRSAIAEACAVATNALRRALQRPDDAAEWVGGVVLCQTQDTRVHQARPDSFLNWQPPAHIGDGNEPRVLLADATSGGHALRAARLFSLLMQQVRLGLLPPRTIRANLVLPIVARFTAEAEVAYGQLVDMRLRPLGEQVALPFVDDARWRKRNRGSAGVGGVAAAVGAGAAVGESARECAANVVYPGVAPAPLVATVVSALPVAALPTAASPLAVDHAAGKAAGPVPAALPSGCATGSPAAENAMSAVVPACWMQGKVPPKFLRDHAILHSLCLCLQSALEAQAGAQKKSVLLSLDDVTKVCRGVAPVLCEQTEQSMRQACRYVCNQVIEKAQVHADACGLNLVMQYNASRDREAGGRVGAVELEAEGAGVSFLLKFALWVVDQMRFHGDTFTSWHVSRSMAARAARTARNL